MRVGKTILVLWVIFTITQLAFGIEEEPLPLNLLGLGGKKVTALALLVNPFSFSDSALIVGTESEDVFLCDVSNVKEQVARQILSYQGKPIRDIKVVPIREGKRQRVFIVGDGYGVMETCLEFASELSPRWRRVQGWERLGLEEEEVIALAVERDYLVGGGREEYTLVVLTKENEVFWYKSGERRWEKVSTSSVRGKINALEIDYEEGSKKYYRLFLGTDTGLYWSDIKFPSRGENLSPQWRAIREFLEKRVTSLAIDRSGAGRLRVLGVATEEGVYLQRGFEKPHRVIEKSASQIALRRIKEPYGYALCVGTSEGAYYLRFEFPLMDLRMVDRKQKAGGGARVELEILSIEIGNLTQEGHSQPSVYFGTSMGIYYYSPEPVHIKITKFKITEGRSNRFSYLPNYEWESEVFHTSDCPHRYKLKVVAKDLTADELIPIFEASGIRDRVVKVLWEPINSSGRAKVYEIMAEVSCEGMADLEGIADLRDTAWEKIVVPPVYPNLRLKVEIEEEAGGNYRFFLILENIGQEPFHLECGSPPYRFEVSDERGEVVWSFPDEIEEKVTSISLAPSGVEKFKCPELWQAPRRGEYTILGMLIMLTDVSAFAQAEVSGKSYLVESKEIRITRVSIDRVSAQREELILDFPNPIHSSLPVSGKGKLYNILGQLVAEFTLEKNILLIPRGIYFYKLDSGKVGKRLFVK
jgi:hypothetical protein